MCDAVCVATGHDRDQSDFDVVPRFCVSTVVCVIVVGDVMRRDAMRQGKIEKHIMREAFDTPDDVYLPQHILYRQKEQFSDGVGYNWIDELRAKAADEVGGDGMFFAFLPSQLVDYTRVKHLLKANNNNSSSSSTAFDVL